MKTNHEKLCSSIEIKSFKNLFDKTENLIDNRHLTVKIQCSVYNHKKFVQNEQQHFTDAVSRIFHENFISRVMSRLEILFALPSTT